MYPFKRLLLVALTLSFTWSFQVQAQNSEKATIRKIKKEIKTYNYSSPREYAEPGRLYPYHRFDGYSREGRMETWEMIEMENAYIKLWILPAIGGKIWGAVDKKSGKEFLYYNHVIKFRDVSSRGPWTSGGLEMNFGIIGHSPWCSSQVDYVLKESPDGSVSCTVGGLDLTLGTDWRVETSLFPDKAYLRTRVLWNNGTLTERPFYQWMNAGIKTEGDLQYYYPGTNYLTHDGFSRSWPHEEGHAIDRYEQNNFGHYKSYHVTGRYTNFWGAYWHKDHYGMAHITPYDDKLGKKIWIWGLSRYGMVWENLLTDSDGQYTEVQSGKLFNQSIGTSYKTPFKHYSLKPGQVYVWDELWMPIGNIGGIDFCNEQLAYTWKATDGHLTLQLYAVSKLDDELILRSNGKEILRKQLSLDPTAITRFDVSTDHFSLDNYELYLGQECLYQSSLNDVDLERPQELPATFDHQTAYGLYLQAKEFANQNFLSPSADLYRQSLAKESNFAPSLIGLAAICFQRNELQEADTLIRRALQVNTYDAAANFLYAQIAERQGRWADAIDGYAIAMQDPTYASMAAKESALLYFKHNRLEECKRLLDKSLLSNPLNLEAQQISIVLSRLSDSKAHTQERIDKLLQIDPLNYVARYEHALLSGEKADRSTLKAMIVNEYWYRTYLSIFSFYEHLGRPQEALDVLSDVADHPALLYRKAYLLHRLGREPEAVDCLKQAESYSVSLIYPNESIDEEVYQWAMTAAPGSWKSPYYLGLLYLSFDRIEEARRLLNDCKDTPDFYAFYLTRAKQITRSESDYRSALRLAPHKYVCSLELGNYYLQQEDYAKAIDCLTNYRKHDADNSYINLLLAKSYAKSKQYQAAIRLLTQTNVLPNEGSLEGRNIWRECHIGHAISQIKAGHYTAARRLIDSARQWPENLGVGKPYDDSTDERLEDLLSWYLQKKLGRSGESYLKPIKQFDLSRHPEAAMNLFTLLFKAKSGATNVTDLHLLFSEPLLKKYPSSAWMKALYNGQIEEAQTAKERPSTEGAPLPFEVRFDDRDFILIKEHYALFEEIIKEIGLPQTNVQ